MDQRNGLGIRMTKTNFDDVVSDWRGEDRPHLAGWTKGGKPIFRGTEAEWRARFIDSEEDMMLAIIFGSRLFSRLAGLRPAQIMSMGLRQQE